MKRLHILAVVLVTLGVMVSNVSAQMRPRMMPSSNAASDSATVSSGKATPILF